ncbi:MAG: tRNA threonylcarbamoyladenosine dehydratase [Ruminococcus sp.]|nr:tRNA threonylcarbamoyladenosine dehydratase [Ruminococcus sp.]
MENQFSRTELIYGKSAMEKLHNARVAVFGIGGVGGFTAEALVRSGVGSIDLIDNDTVCESNLNRQIIALHTTIGKYKVDVAEERFKDINPDINIVKHARFFIPDNSSEFEFEKYDYIVDAIDTVTGKIELVMKANEFGVPIISSMGAGNKKHPELFEISDIYKTSVCPLARVMRQELRKRGIKKLKVVYSKEMPAIPSTNNKNPDGVFKKAIPGSCAFVPSVVGLIMAGEIVNDLTSL